METFECIASNIKCMGCVNNIKNGLLEMSDITEVSADVETGKVIISGTSLNPRDITEKMGQLGYPVNP